MHVHVYLHVHVHVYELVPISAVMYMYMYTYDNLVLLLCLSSHFVKDFQNLLKQFSEHVNPSHNAVEETRALWRKIKREIKSRWKKGS